MAYNVSGWGTAAPNAKYWVGYLINGGQDFGAQFAQANPEGATIDGTQNGSFTSYDHDIYLGDRHPKDYLLFLGTERISST